MARRIAVGRKAQYSTLIDEEFYAAVTRYKWTFKSWRGLVYARRCTWIAGSKRTIYLSGFILELAKVERPSPSHTPDHKNRDTLDNRLENLRWATPSEQAYNRSKSRLPLVLEEMLREEIPF